MIVSAPKNGNELRKLMYTALSINDQPFSIRYPKADSIEFQEKEEQVELLPVGSWEVEKKGEDIQILAVGPMVYNALEVAKKLNVIGLNLEVVNCRFIKPMDTSYLKSAVSKFSTFITLEESNTTGGFGDGISSWLLENNFKGKLKRIGLPDSFVFLVIDLKFNKQHRITVSLLIVFHIILYKSLFYLLDHYASQFQ